MTILVENYLDFLNKDLRAAAHEWQGPNIPYGDDSNRPNLIRQCTMLENSKMKINCLRKLRDQAAMNPFYQHRIDRYIDEITDTYEPTEKPGTIPGNEFKETGVGEDTKLETLREAAADKVMVGAGAAIGGGLAAWRVKRCKRAHPNDRKKFKKCLMQWKATWKIKPEEK
jgi:hypothetical protein